MLGNLRKRELFFEPPQKRQLRKAEAHTPEALVEAMGPANSSITDEDARGFLEHCGYGTPVQLL